MLNIKTLCPWNFSYTLPAWLSLILCDPDRRGAILESFGPWTVAGFNSCLSCCCCCLAMDFFPLVLNGPKIGRRVARFLILSLLVTIAVLAKKANVWWPSNSFATWLKKNATIYGIDVPWNKLQSHSEMVFYGFLYDRLSSGSFMVLSEQVDHQFWRVCTVRIYIYINCVCVCIYTFYVLIE